LLGLMPFRSGAGIVQFNDRVASMHPITIAYLHPTNHGGLRSLDRLGA
jgi:hypothetical protein